MARYAPQPVPSTGNPDLERYIAEELNRLAIPLQRSTAEAYGGLTFTVDTPLVLGPTPIKLTNWTSTRPVTMPALGVDVDAAAGELTPLEGGIYYASAFISAEVDTQVTFTMTAYINDAPSDGLSAVRAATPPPGQITLGAGTIADLGKGLRFSLYLSADTAASDFEINYAEFSMFRVSEEF